MHQVPTKLKETSCWLSFQQKLNVVKDDRVFYDGFRTKSERKAMDILLKTRSKKPNRCHNLYSEPSTKSRIKETAKSRLSDK